MGPVDHESCFIRYTSNRDHNSVRPYFSSATGCPLCSLISFTISGYYSARKICYHYDEQWCCTRGWISAIRFVRLLHACIAFALYITPLFSFCVSFLNFRLLSQTILFRWRQPNEWTNLVQLAWWGDYRYNDRYKQCSRGTLQSWTSQCRHNWKVAYLHPYFNMPSDYFARK